MSQSKNQYMPVNWMDGMKINKSHFIAQNNAFTQQAAMSTSSLLNEYNYGLLPNTHQSCRVKIFVSADNQQQVQVRLQSCIAVTLGGHIIQFDENDGSFNNLRGFIPDVNTTFAELKEKSSEYYVVIVVNPYKRIPYGDADPDETPLRIPYTSPSYDLQLIPVNETRENALGNFHVPVGKVRIEEQKILLDEYYIAPCCSISSHADLMEIHASVENFFGKMELYALQIIQKILQKGLSNEMTATAQKLCEQISSFTALRLNEFRQINLYQPPVFLINTVSSFARLMKNTLDFYMGSGKEELLNYCSERGNVNQRELESAIATLTYNHYNHLNIRDSIEKISEFTKLISHFFSNLTKLEYKKQPEDTGIFVTAQPVNR